MELSHHRHILHIFFVIFFLGDYFTNVRGEPETVSPVSVPPTESSANSTRPECPPYDFSVEAEVSWLEKVVIGNFRVWHIMFSGIAVFTAVTVVLCCIFRCRIPRTKQEIEADFLRKKITKGFLTHLERIKLDELQTDFNRENLLPVFKKVEAFEEEKIQYGFINRKLTWKQKFLRFCGSTKYDAPIEVVKESDDAKKEGDVTDGEGKMTTEEMAEIQENLKGIKKETMALDMISDQINIFGFLAETTEDRKKRLKELRKIAKIAKKEAKAEEKAAKKAAKHPQEGAVRTSVSGGPSIARIKSTAALKELRADSLAKEAEEAKRKEAEEIAITIEDSDQVDEPKDYQEFSVPVPVEEKVPKKSGFFSFRDTVNKLMNFKTVKPPKPPKKEALVINIELVKIDSDDERPPSPAMPTISLPEIKYTSIDDTQSRTSKSPEVPDDGGKSLHLLKPPSKSKKRKTPPSTVAPLPPPLLPLIPPSPTPSSSSSLFKKRAKQVVKKSKDERTMKDILGLMRKKPKTDPDKAAMLPPEQTEVEVDLPGKKIASERRKSTKFKEKAAKVAEEHQQQRRESSSKLVKLVSDATRRHKADKAIKLQPTQADDDGHSQLFHQGESDRDATLGVEQSSSSPPQLSMMPSSSIDIDHQRHHYEDYEFSQDIEQPSMLRIPPKDELTKVKRKHIEFEVIREEEEERDDEDDPRERTKRDTTKDKIKGAIKKIKKTEIESPKDKKDSKKSEKKKKEDAEKMLKKEKKRDKQLEEDAEKKAKKLSKKEDKESEKLKKSKPTLPEVTFEKKKPEKMLKSEKRQVSVDGEKKKKKDAKTEVAKEKPKELKALKDDDVKTKQKTVTMMVAVDKPKGETHGKPKTLRKVSLEEPHSPEDEFVVVIEPAKPLEEKLSGKVLKRSKTTDVASESSKIVAKAPSSEEKPQLDAAALLAKKRSLLLKKRHTQAVIEHIEPEVKKPEVVKKLKRAKSEKTIEIPVEHLAVRSTPGIRSPTVLRRSPNPIISVPLETFQKRISGRGEDGQRVEMSYERSRDIIFSIPTPPPLLVEERRWPTTKPEMELKSSKKSSEKDTKRSKPEVTEPEPIFDPLLCEPSTSGVQFKPETKKTKKKK